jgi:hypothetical protein
MVNVSDLGEINASGIYVEDANNGVRPALWIDLDA